MIYIGGFGMDEIVEEFIKLNDGTNESLTYSVNILEFKKLIHKKKYDVQPIESVLKLERNNGFIFSAYTLNHADTDSITYSILPDDPLYNSLSYLLGSNDHIVVDDDKTIGNFRKYLIIEKSSDGNSITLNFYNNMHECEDYDPNYKWYITVHGGSDSNNDTEIIRNLYTFFENALSEFPKKDINEEKVKKIGEIKN